MYFAPGLLKGLKTQSFLVRIETIADVGMFLPQRPFINFRGKCILASYFELFKHISRGIFIQRKRRKDKVDFLARGLTSLYQAFDCWEIRWPFDFTSFLLFPHGMEKLPYLANASIVTHNKWLWFPFPDFSLEFIFLEYRIIFIAALTFILY